VNGVFDSAFGSTLFPDSFSASSSGSSRRLQATIDGVAELGAGEELPAYMEKPEDAFMF
jgi:hypothetical protein